MDSYTATIATISSIVLLFLMTRVFFVIERRESDYDCGYSWVMDEYLDNGRPLAELRDLVNNGLTFDDAKSGFDLGAIAACNELDEVNVRDEFDALQAELKAANERIEKLKAQNQWISVKDRLPVLEEQVLVWHSGKLEIRIGVLLKETPTFEDPFNAFHYWDDYYQDGQGWDWQNITHWMPLPYTPIKYIYPTQKIEVCDE